MTKYDLWLSFYPTNFFFFRCFLLIWKKAGGPPTPPHPPVALVILSDLVIEHQAKGRTKKEKHDLSKDEHVEVPTEMQILSVSHRLLRIISGPRDTYLTPKPNTRAKRERYFSEWTACRFLTSSQEFTKDCYF